MKLAVNLAMKRLRRLSPCAAASDRSMPADILIALLGFAFATSITPGPNNILVMASSLNHSVARTIPVVLGISAGFAFMLLAVGIGLGAAIRVNASLNTATKAFGFAYTLWLAWKVQRVRPRSRFPPAPRNRSRHSLSRCSSGSTRMRGISRSRRREPTQRRMRRMSVSPGSHRSFSWWRFHRSACGPRSAALSSASSTASLGARLQRRDDGAACRESIAGRTRDRDGHIIRSSASEFSRHLRLHSEVVSLFSDAC